MKPIVSCIAYGLGNQLMQFSAGYILSSRLSRPLDLDISWFDNKNTQKVTSRDLGVVEIVGRSSYRHLLKYPIHSRVIDRISNKFSGPRRPARRHGLPIWHRRWNPIWPFQSIDIAVCVYGVPSLEIFTKVELDQAVSTVFRSVQSSSRIVPVVTDYAFVRVRLGDFVSSPHVRAKMVDLKVDYYETAMRLYEARNGKTRWILLSDEPENALSRMPSNFSVELGGGSSEFDDLFLMAKSRGGVIANSTFSLWGGLLAAHKGGDVVAPSVWRQDGRPSPVLPSTWMIV